MLKWHDIQKINCCKILKQKSSSFPDQNSRGCLNELVVDPNGVHTKGSAVRYCCAKTPQGIPTEIAVLNSYITSLTWCKHLLFVTGVQLSLARYHPLLVIDVDSGARCCRLRARPLHEGVASRIGRS